MDVWWVGDKADGVALFTRAWIEISPVLKSPFKNDVALFTRAWIEIILDAISLLKIGVALFTRAWIEINFQQQKSTS